MHHSLILKYTSHQSRKNTKHFIHLSNTRICMKATTNKVKFKLSQLLPLEKAFSFQEITDVWCRQSFQVWIRNLWLKNLWRASMSIIHLRHETCVRKLSMALSLGSCSLYFSKFIDFNIPFADLSALENIFLLKTDGMEMFKILLLLSPSYVLMLTWAEQVKCCENWF